MTVKKFAPAGATRDPSRPPPVLRRRFDSLKWDVKKCEDIVFDLQVSKRMIFMQPHLSAHCDGFAARGPNRRAMSIAVVTVTASALQVRGLGKAAVAE